MRVSLTAGTLILVIGGCTSPNQTGLSCESNKDLCASTPTLPPLSSRRGVWTSTTLTADGLEIVAYDVGLGALHSLHLDEDGLQLTHRITSNDPATDRGQYVALTQGPNDQLYAAYYDAVGTNIRRARRSDGNWEELPGAIDNSDHQVGTWLSLAADDSGGWHLAYRDETTATLRIVSLDSDTVGCHGAGGPETPMEITPALMADAGWPSADFGTHTSIGILTDGRLAVSFYDAWRTNLMLATCTGNDIQLQLLDGEGSQASDDTDVGRWNALAVDPASGRLGIAYHDATHGALKYISSRDGTLASVVIDDGQPHGHYVGVATSLAYYTDENLDEGLPRIAYIDTSSRQLKLARQSVYGLWESNSISTHMPNSGVPSGYGPSVNMEIRGKESEFITFTQWAEEEATLHVATCDVTECTEVKE